MSPCKIVDTNKNLPPEVNSDNVMKINPHKQKIKINNFIFNTATRTLYQSENVGGWFYLANVLELILLTESFTMLQTRPQYFLSTNKYHKGNKY